MKTKQNPAGLREFSKFQNIFSPQLPFTWKKLVKGCLTGQSQCQLPHFLAATFQKVGNEGQMDWRTRRGEGPDDHRAKRRMD